MPDTDAGQGVVIPVGECRCPGTPHALDTVTLRPTAGLSMGIAATIALRHAGRLPGDVEAALGSVYLRYGIVAWTFVSETGPVRITPENIDEWLPWDKGGEEVADKADDLYSVTVLAPLLRRSAERLRTTPETDSTSPTPPSGESSPTSPPPSSLSQPADGTPSEPIGASA